MNVRKVSRKAAHRSLDGHIRFVVAMGQSIHVFDLSALATCGKRVNIIAAFSGGRCVVRTSH